MAGQVDIFTFLKRRNIPDNIVHQLKDDKIDINVINVMTDEELGKYIERYGDRLALRAFCRQITGTNETTVKSGERTTAKSSLMEKIRVRLQGKGEKADPDVGPGVGNKHASKDSRRVEIGWLNFQKGKYYQVRTRQGGGTRHMSVQKTMTMEELLDIGKALFFPNGKSAKGPLKDFKFDVRDFSHCPVPLENTVQQLYDQTKLRMLRIYTCSKEKDKELSPKDATIMLSDSSSDFEPTDHRPIKTRRKQRLSVRNQPRRYHTSRIGTDHPVHHIERSSDSDEEHSTLNDDAASPRGSEKEVHYVKFRRVNIVQDVLNVFMDPRVMEVQLIMELINEKALDGEGVSREVYSAFWELFLKQCEGEDERVPRLWPDYSEKEWQAVGRVWIKGYMDHNIIPIRLSPAFILSCCQGVSSVDEELLMMSFLRYLSVTERESVEKVLEGNLEEIDEEDLLDLFSHCLPSKDNIRAAIVVMAHKALLQEPKFIIDCFHSSIHNAVPRLLTKESIMELYENKRPTNRKVAQMIKPSNESLNPQEQAALTYLLRYVRSLDQRKLEIFLRFCTGSSVLCKDSIEVTFNRLCGLSRRPVAHTCGAVLELPCTYSSYPDFRAELDSVLSGDCFTMDIL
ncbi:hypothetical protein JOQ06_006846 [Pogonophryne albipinna]|uniref:HECT domain-containing protein n=1 Tax=Pogonophryne albipinna TaxID=1090488 RepID=A0AAD6B0H1_9TELE|nr:hypothetical protein JOQ06_006846 [Pogonophryne albipinna]